MQTLENKINGYLLDSQQQLFKICHGYLANSEQELLKIIKEYNESDTSFDLVLYKFIGNLEKQGVITLAHKTEDTFEYDVADDYAMYYDKSQCTSVDITSIILSNHSITFKDGERGNVIKCTRDAPYLLSQIKYYPRIKATKASDMDGQLKTIELLEARIAKLEQLVSNNEH